MDPRNPTCPADPDWSDHQQMRFTEHEADGQRVLLAEGVIDGDTPARLQAALEGFRGDEVWLRSPGGDARAGNEAGRVLRQNGVLTRIPSGWACHAACNFMFMGGFARFVDPGGHFIVQTGIGPFGPDQLDGPPVSREVVNEVAQASAIMATEDDDYLIRMGLSRAFLSEILYRRPDDGSTRRCLTQEELARYNVTNQPLGRLRPPTSAETQPSDRK